MHLGKLIDIVTGSSPKDWHLIADKPSFHDRLEFYEVYNGQPNVLHSDAHHSVASYIPDVSITMAWGLEWNKDFKEDWCANFPAPKAHGGYLDIFFNNALVYRSAYVWVDGVTLPLPQRKGGKLEVTKRGAALMKIIDAMGRSPRPDFNPYESDINRAGFIVVDKSAKDFEGETF
jgi:hypothetical protein